MIVTGGSSCPGNAGAGLTETHTSKIQILVFFTYALLSYLEIFTFYFNI